MMRYRQCGIVVSILMATALIYGCKGKPSMASASFNIPTRAWNLGRFVVHLPDLATLTDQTQVLDGIDVTLESPSPVPLKTQLAKRVGELTKDQRSPLVTQYEWSSDTGAVLHVMDISDPTYYQLEGRRLFPKQTVVATTDGDKSKVDVMQAIVQEILKNYVPGDDGLASFNRFGLIRGSLQQAFHNSEEVHAEFTLPDTGTRLEFDSKVIARPVVMDLFEREAGAVAEAKESGLVINVLRKKHRTVAGQDGVELVDTGVSRQQRQYAAYFETPGAPNSPSQTHLVIRFYTEDILPNPLNEEQFLALWDAILDSLKVAP